ncbi:hypothetical protein STEG23_013816 [Scotinomys teguina]
MDTQTRKKASGIHMVSTVEKYKTDKPGFPEHIKVGGMQFSTATIGDFNFDHLVTPLSDIHDCKKGQFYNLAGT